ncbi:MAG TPA: hypothetical protein VMI72_11120 [Roseiarcus sp.]|nr:hypothetical protein [Roseiarcus sp.]
MSRSGRSNTSCATLCPLPSASGNGMDAAPTARKTSGGARSPRHPAGRRLSVQAMARTKATDQRPMKGPARIAQT